MLPSHNVTGHRSSVASAVGLRRHIPDAILMRLRYTFLYYNKNTALYRLSGTILINECVVVRYLLLLLLNHTKKPLDRHSSNRVRPRPSRRYTLLTMGDFYRCSPQLITECAVSITRIVSGFHNLYYGVGPPSVPFLHFIVFVPFNARLSVTRLFLFHPRMAVCWEIAGLRLRFSHI